MNLEIDKSEREREVSGVEECVLVLAPSLKDAQVASEALIESGFTARVCRDVGELCREIRDGADTAVIAGEALTPPACEQLAHTLSRQPPWSDFPLVVLVGNGRATESEEAALRLLDQLGNITLLERPLRIATLLRSVQVALRSRRRQYEIREHLRERARAEKERIALLEKQRTFLRDILASVTEGKLHLCDTPADLPPHLSAPDGYEEPLALTPRSLRQLRVRVTLSAAELLGFGPERTDDLVTAAHEAAMNAIAHAGGGTASVGIDVSTGTLQVWIADQGQGIDMERLPRATLERGFSSAGTLGHGFWLMLRFVDRLWLLTGPQGTTIVLEQERTPPTPAWYHRQ